MNKKNTILLDSDIQIDHVCPTEETGFVSCKQEKIKGGKKDITVRKHVYQQLTEWKVRESDDLEKKNGEWKLSKLWIGTYLVDLELCPHPNWLKLK